VATLQMPINKLMYAVSHLYDASASRAILDWPAGNCRCPLPRLSRESASPAGQRILFQGSARSRSYEAEADDGSAEYRNSGRVPKHDRPVHAWAGLAQLLPAAEENVLSSGVEPSSLPEAGGRHLVGGPHHRPSTPNAATLAAAHAA
jgi:hypothetical protein